MKDKKICRIHLIKTSIVILILAMISSGIVTILLKKNALLKEDVMSIKAMQNELISYKIYDNTDNDNVKALAIINSMQGIEYVIKPNGDKIETYGKKEIGIDYQCKIDEEVKYKIKEVNEEEVEKTLVISEAGNETYPFIIRNADELQKISNYPKNTYRNSKTVKLYYRLESDIDLTNIEFQPIGTTTDPFRGVIDGNGHKITNLNIDKTEEYQGLVSSLSGIIKNLTLENPIVKGTNNIGAIAGYNTGEIKDCTIENAQIEATGNLVGGVCGNSTGKINNNKVVGKVTGNSYVGGIVGNTSNVTSGNQADITITSAGNYVGGIVGNTTNSTSDNEVEAEITGVNYVGGLIGNTNHNVINNKTKNTIQAQQYVGGLVGCKYSNEWTQNTNSSNSIETTIRAISCVGGLIGYNNVENYGWDHNSTTSISKNDVIMDIEADTHIGGLIGYSRQVNLESAYWEDKAITYISNCFAVGKLKGKQNVGGLIGYNQCSGRYRGSIFKAQLDNCYSGIKIESEGTAGMIIAYGNCYLDQSYTTINNCYSVNKIIGEANNRGIEKNLDEMVYKNTFGNWNFDTIWAIEEGTTTPYLQENNKPQNLNKQFIQNILDS